MSAKVIKRKKTRKQRQREVLEQDEFTTRGQQVYEFVETNWKPIAGVIGGLLLIAVVGAGISSMGDGKEEQAAAALYEAEQELPAAFGTTTAADLEADEFEVALSGLAKVIDEHPSSDAARVAALQAGNMLLEVGRYDDALGYFDKVKQRKDLVAIQAQAGAAAAYEGKGESKDAAKRLRKAASLASGSYKQLIHMELGRVVEAAGDTDEAVKVYEDVVKADPDGTKGEKAQQRLDLLGSKSADGAAASE